jgi:hypothetical protein
MKFELRTYVANPGKMSDLLKRFENYTDRIFKRYGMESLGYWISAEDSNILVYIIKHQGSPEINWKNFLDDTEWKDAFEKSEKNGSLVNSIISQFLSSVDFSSL